MIEASAASDLGFWIDAIGRLVVATAAGMVLDVLKLQRGQAGA